MNVEPGSSGELERESPVAQFVKVSKAFGDNLILDQLDLEVVPGEKVAIIGPSGSGKTSVLRALAGLLEPDSGDVFVDGWNVWRKKTRSGADIRADEAHLRKARACVGMVFQQFNLFPNLTARQNVSAPLVYVRKSSRRVAEEEATAMLGLVGLSDHLDKYPGQLSGGQQQRVAIARALAMKPKVMLFDEVTSALDPETVGSVLHVIRDIAVGTDMTMLLVTHEISFAERFADRIIMFDHGRIVEQGTPAEILHNPQEPRTQQFLNALLDRD